MLIEMKFPDIDIPCHLSPPCFCHFMGACHFSIYVRVIGCVYEHDCVKVRKSACHVGAQNARHEQNIRDRLRNVCP